MGDLIARIWREVAKFGAVGAAAFVIDTVIFVWLIAGPMDDSHVKAKAIAVAVATLFSWLGNRYWTFRHRRTKTKTRELVMFVLMNLIGLAIQSGCVAISFYILGLTSPEASFVSGSIIGMGLAMVFRFVAYKFWVFTGDADAAESAARTGSVETPHAISDADILGPTPRTDPGTGPCRITRRRGPPGEASAARRRPLGCPGTARQSPSGQRRHHSFGCDVVPLRDQQRRGRSCRTGAEDRLQRLHQLIGC
ncbi:GtrA family protein [Nesterenkonia pannonica]|uniref:GtrA family protein n=1 Tax=Nesterenkonia pannonica TaxID=1548602 RepID=UPI0021645859|nr:GtrA family protein [Nesterenkonia pannonica]